MRMCVYDLAVGSDVAVNETEVAKVREASRLYHRHMQHRSCENNPVS